MEQYNGIDVSVDRLKKREREHQTVYNDDRVDKALLGWAAKRITELEAELAKKDISPLLQPTDDAKKVFKAFLANNPNADMEAVPKQWLLNERAIVAKAVDKLEEENKTLRVAFSANEEDNAEYLERIEELEKTCEEWCDAKSLDESAIDLQEQLSKCLAEKAELEKFVIIVRDELLYPLSMTDSEFSVIAECMGQNTTDLINKTQGE